jgi:hypothetical protein
MTGADARPRWESELLLARARRNVAERAFRAAVGAAAAAGATPGEIADALLVPVRSVEPILDGLAADGAVVEDPYAVAERYAVGELSREEMRARLVEWTYVPDRQMADYWDDAGVTPKGSFSSTVGRAFDDGLIDEEDYDFVVRRHKVGGRGD